MMSLCMVEMVLERWMWGDVVDLEADLGRPGPRLW